MATFFHFSTTTVFSSMRWWTFVVGVCLSIGLKADTLGQDLLRTSSHISLNESSAKMTWDAALGQDATGNLIFQSLASLLQLAPNSRYPNGMQLYHGAVLSQLTRASSGHSIVRATIPTGTLLYHGRPWKLAPTREWLAFDPEHAMMFAASENGTLFTYMTTQELNVIYFDGASANKFNGVVDTQDILLWGEVNHVPHDGAMGELDRMDAGCAWGQQYGVDGLLRMQLDLCVHPQTSKHVTQPQFSELMYCDFSQGIRLISTASMVAGDGILNALSPDRRKQSFSFAQVPMQMSALNSSDRDVASPPTRGDQKPLLHPVVPPPGWKGSLPSSFWQGRHAGTWHNGFPGELRIKVYTSSMITFYDPALESLVQARRRLTRDAYRLEGISPEDTARVRADIEEVMTRGPANSDSGVDWQALAHVIQDRFSDRLPFIRYLLHQENTNATAQAVLVRRELIASLLPYMQREDVGASEWFAQIAHGCATRFTAHLPSSSFTKQEHILRNAIDEVLHEICRVYTGAWRETFDVEEQSAEVALSVLERWRGAFDALIEWLGWPVWVTCNPLCGVDVSVS